MGERRASGPLPDLNLDLKRGVQYVLGWKVVIGSEAFLAVFLTLLGDILFGPVVGTCYLLRPIKENRLQSLFKRDCLGPFFVRD